MSSQNPYSALATDTFSEQQKQGYSNQKKFNQQIVALGVFWILIGLATLGFISFAFLSADAENIDVTTIAVVLGGTFGLVWSVIGIFACVRSIMAVRVGLVLCYISLVGQILFVNVCGIVILGLVIAQAHRIVGWSKPDVRRSRWW